MAHSRQYTQTESMRATQPHDYPSRQFPQHPLMAKRSMEPTACNEFSQAAFLRGTDSPPSLSLTAESPEKTTEKKLVNVVSTQKKKLAVAPLPELNFRCLDCKKSHKGNFLQYTNSESFGNCAICGCFQNLTAAQLAQKMGYGADPQKQQHAVVQGLRSSNQ